MRLHETGQKYNPQPQNNSKTRSVPFLFAAIFCYLNTRQVISKLTISPSQRISGILSVTLQYDSGIVPISRYGNDTGISLAA